MMTGQFVNTRLNKSSTVPLSTSSLIQHCGRCFLQNYAIPVSIRQWPCPRYNNDPIVSSETATFDRHPVGTDWAMGNNM